MFDNCHIVCMCFKDVKYIALFFLSGNLTMDLWDVMLVLPKKHVSIVTALSPYALAL